MRPAQLLSILEREFRSPESGHHTPVMLWGPPGVGKSDMVAQVAANGGGVVVDIRLSQMEPSDLRGIPFHKEGLVEWSIPALLPDESRHGRQGILFLDEITSAPPTVSAAAYQLILDRRLGEYRVPDGWAIFAAGNRQGDRGVTYTMPSPLANRFSHYEVDVHLDDWVRWAWEHGVDERVIAFLRFRPELIYDFDPAHNPVAFPTPRSWEFAHRALQKFETETALLRGALQGCVGSAAGLELAAFIDNLHHLPDLDRIVRGEGGEVPQAIDLQYAVATALVGRAIKIKGEEGESVMLGHILDYANRFPQREMGVMLVSDLHRAVGEKLFQVPQFGEWAQAIATVMLY